MSVAGYRDPNVVTTAACAHCAVLMDQRETVLSNEGDVLCRSCHSHMVVNQQRTELAPRAPARSCRACSGSNTAVAVGETQHVLNHFIPLGRTLHYRCTVCGREASLRSGSRVLLAVAALATTILMASADTKISTELALFAVVLVVVQLAFFAVDFVRRANFPR